MKEIVKNKEILKCIMCGEEMPNINHDECPNCKNTLGFSTHTIKVISVGELLAKKQLSEELFAFVFDFDFEMDCLGNMSSINLAKIKKPFLGVTVSLDICNGFGLGGVQVSAVFNGRHEFEVELSDEHLEYLSQQLLASFIGDAGEIDDEDVEEDIDFSDDSIDGVNEFVLSLVDMADDMFSITSDCFMVNEEMWEEIPEDIKVDMVKTLQENPEDIVSLLNVIKFGYSIPNLDSLVERIETIIKSHYEDYMKDNEIEDSVSEEDIEDDNVLDELIETLKSKHIVFNISESFEMSDFSQEHEMVSILDSENEECLHIAKINEEYYVCEDVKKLKEYKVFDINHQNTAKLNVNQILSLITSMGLSTEEHLKAVDEAHIEDIIHPSSLDLEDDVFADSFIEEEEHLEDFVPTISKREILLKEIQELSDEDIINELNRRLSLR